MARVCKEHCKVEEIKFTHKKTQNVWKGCCINHTNEYIDYNAMDKETGEIYIIKEISFDSKENNLEEAKLHLSRLIELEHNNLFKIKNFVHSQASPNQEVFYILQESNFGYTTLSLFLTENVTLDTTYLKSISKDIADAIRYLKERNFERVQILHSSVYVDNKGNIKLYDYGLEALISNTICASNVDSPNSAYTFGILLLSLLQGKLIDANAIQNIPIDYQEYLDSTKCQNADELLQSILSEAASNVEFIREPGYSLKIELTRNNSRLHTNYKKIERLGKGAFGKVYKIQDLTDNKFYALKTIKLNNKNHNNDEKIFKEVWHLSELEHKHIVRYYHSWEGEEDSDSSESAEEDDDYDDYSDSLGTYIEHSQSGIQTYTYQNPDICEKNEDSIINLSVRSTLFIKMEFCEGNTLSDVIDNTQLYENSTLIWKYFKQILKGLQHIHDKGIIHRDLKPLNIFLDSNNQIKIGDFGFATNKIRFHPLDEEKLKKLKTLNDEKYTSRVGTIYYKAPELNSSLNRICDYKLDMYSLGIILFEMCYEPFQTLSERAKVLTDLRELDVIFPDNFNSTKFEKQMTIIRKLLSHDTELRPSCDELIKSALMPHFPEEKEEEKQLQLIQHIANNPQSRSYQNFFDCCFEKENNLLSSVDFDNITYIEATIKIITEIFRKHGGQNYDIKSLSLKNVCSDNCKLCIKTVNKRGKVIVVPCSSRIPFLQYVVLNDCSWLRRYSVQKNYILGENKYQCAFDIITPIDLRKHKCFLPDAEILLILSELINSFPSLSSNNFILTISHTDFIEAVFEECNYLLNPMNRLIISLPLTFLVQLRDCQADTFKHYDIDKHIKLLSSFNNCDFQDLSILEEFVNRRARIKAMQALSELAIIINVARDLGVQCDINLQFSTFKTFDQYSGMLVMLSYKHQDGIKTIAVGGRYDNSLKNIGSMSKNYVLNHCGVGLTIYIERLNEVLKIKKSLNLSEVIICSDSNTVLPRIHKILKMFWENNISCSFIKMTNMKSCKKYCLKNKFVFVITVKQSLLNTKKVQITYRKNSHTSQTWIVDIDMLVLATKTLLHLEPLDQIILKNNVESTVLYRTTSKLTFFDKAKCKCLITQELNNQQFFRYEPNIFVINFNSVLVQEDFNTECTQLTVQNRKILSSIREDIMQKKKDKKNILIMFADTSQNLEDDILEFSYYFYDGNKLIIM